MIRKNKPRVGRLVSELNGGTRFISKLHMASGRAVSVIRVILTNGMGGSLMGLLRVGNKGTVNVSNISNELVRTGAGGRGLNCINRVAGVGVSPIASLLRGKCVPIVSAITYSGGNGACGVGNSATTTCVTNTLKTRDLVVVASITKLLHSGSSPSALVPRMGISSVGRLFSSNVVYNKVVPGMGYYARTVTGNIHGIFVVSKHVPRSVLVRVLASRNTNAVMENRGWVDKFSSGSGACITGACDHFPIRVISNGNDVMFSTGKGRCVSVNANVKIAYFNVTSRR